MTDNQYLILNRQYDKKNSVKVKLYSSPVISLKKDAKIDRVLLKMQLNYIKTVLITSGKTPLGVVTETDIVKFLEEDKTSRALDEIPVTELMTGKLISITGGQLDHLNQCAQRMEIFKIGAIIIRDEYGKVTGITSKSDITNAYSVMYPGKFKVKDYMTKKVTTCRKSDSIQFALNMINKNGISRLVVTDQYGIPAGIITRNTFLKHTNNFKKSSHKALDYWNPTKLSKTLPVEKILNHDILLVDLEDDLTEAARLMIKNLVSGIPVIDKEKIWLVLLPNLMLLEHLLK
ncbi:MAG TPA: CBS domain-containing protein [Nitrosopumilus sp.]|nr:CBS domain-containing protein [Nitrosopumilus sp.]